MELTLKNVKTWDVNQFIGHEITCSCGRSHKMDVEKVIIENGAIQKLPEIVQGFSVQKSIVVADTNTYKVAGKLVEELLDKHGLAYKTFVYETDHDLVPDETAIGRLVLEMEDAVGLIITVGSGVLNDIGKIVSRRTKAPSIVVATAPSMDGYVSDTSALTVGNLKKSVACTLPKVIIGDVDIMKQAPMRMILAGLGDMIGKCSALIDWKLSRLINDEYYCEATAQISEDAVQKCIDNIDGVKKRDDEAVKNVMEGLIRTGIAMSYVNNSRPASGSEHHLSHFWEMKFLFEGKEALLHGTKVGLTSILVGKLYEMFPDEKVDFDAAVEKAKAFDAAKWEAQIKKLYGKAAPGLLAAAKKDGRNSIEARLERIQKIKDNYDKILEIIRSAKTATFIEDIMKRAGAPLRPQEVGVDAQTVFDSMLVAKEVRTRYTILNLIADLGLDEKYAEKIKTFIGK